MVRKFLVISSILVSAALFSGLPEFSSVLAASDSSSFQASASTKLSDPVYAYNQLGNLVSLLFTVIIMAGAITAIGFFIFGAIQYGTAGENANGAAKARSTMTAAIVGLILLGLVYVFIHFYNNILPTANVGPGS